MNTPPYRIGFGFDTHMLAHDRELWVGGIKIPHHQGFSGHSDADVLIHAICDAMLGAAHLRDIGYHFPNTDPQWKGADSKILLKKCLELISQKNYKIANIDCTLVMEEPKISPYIVEMENCLASVLQISSDDISIKATTNEKMGYIGRKEGANAYAICLLYSIN
ncbi:MAG: 2-C-methyl-D-erythritol 2,4-cyclodiphosphate synthase [Cytophagales bacterium]|nr:2-C-methyl-D-erythritol 2,4-cyclodiphosphate synthase [Cytophagales bacterium]